VPPRSAFSLEEAAAAAGQGQQHERAGEGKTRTPVHAHENASSFFNETSTIPAHKSVKDKKPLTRETRTGSSPHVVGSVLAS
jgi:hypothetical protein